MMLPIAAGHARGNALQETLIAIGLRTAAVSLIAVAMLILWGLRLGVVATRVNEEGRDQCSVWIKFRVRSGGRRPNPPMQRTWA